MSSFSAGIAVAHAPQAGLRGCFQFSVFFSHWGKRVHYVLAFGEAATRQKATSYIQGHVQPEMQMLPDCTQNQKVKASEDLTTTEVALGSCLVKP